MVIRIKAENLSKKFGYREVFRGINFELSSPHSMVITGPNGSGKSTLLKIITNLYTPTTGAVSYLQEAQPLSFENLRKSLVFVSPEMNFYDELTGSENLDFLMSVSGGIISSQKRHTALEQAGLGKREDDLVKEYSSGMKMRLKLALAFLKHPPVLVIDEPSTNLDSNGRELVYQMLEEQRNKGILIYATNEESEIGFADERIILGR